MKHRLRLTRDGSGFTYDWLIPGVPDSTVVYGWARGTRDEAQREAERHYAEWRYDCEEVGAQAADAGMERAVRCNGCGVRWEVPAGRLPPAPCPECRASGEGSR